MRGVRVVPATRNELPEGDPDTALRSIWVAANRPRRREAGEGRAEMAWECRWRLREPSSIDKVLRRSSLLSGRVKGLWQHAAWMPCGRLT